MILNDLQEKKFARLHRTLSEVFNIDFNFEMPLEKIQKVAKVTESRLEELRSNGVDASNKNFQKLMLIAEGLKLVVTEVAPARTDKKIKIKESADLDQAEVLLAAKQVADDLQKMAENLASMQVEDLMSITNAMKEEIGLAEAEAFNAAAEAAIGGALEAVKSANDGVNNALMVAQGQAPADDMSMDMGMDPEAPAEDPMPDMDAPEMDAPEDEFGGADAADAMVDDTGREMKEDAYLKALKMVKEAQVEGKVNKAVLKQAFESLKAYKAEDAPGNVGKKKPKYQTFKPDEKTYTSTKKN
jgi:hypothetical protein